MSTLTGKVRGVNARRVTSDSSTDIFRKIKQCIDFRKDVFSSIGSFCMILVVCFPLSRRQF